MTRLHTTHQATRISALKPTAVLVLILALFFGCGGSSTTSQPGNRVPVVGNPGSQAGIVGASASLSITASDADGDSLRFSAVDAIDPATYVIVVGDNGTPMYGPAATNFIDNMYITRYGRGKGTVYESGVRASMAIRGPGIAAGITSDASNHCVDLFATILDLAGANVPGMVPNSGGNGVVELDSVSLAPVLFAGADRVRDPDYGYVISENVNPLANDTRLAAAKNASYKLLCEEDTQIASCTFYDLSDDPLEEYPLAKPGSCYYFENGIWTPEDSFWHFCSLLEVLRTQSFLGEP
jgi:hypothetical protein